CLAQADAAAVRLFLSHQHAQEGGLTGAVAADDADDGAFGNAEAEVVDQLAIAEALAQVLHFDDHITQAWAWWNIKFSGLVAFLEFLRIQLFEARQSRLALGLAAL